MYLGFISGGFITEWGMDIGILLMMVLFAFALANKINGLQRERLAAQSETIRIQQDATVTLEQKVADRTAELQARNEIMENDIALARKIQDTLIPDKNPAPYIASVYKPMQQVGGDFYDFIAFADSKKIGIFLSDVSGHGVPAAFITSMIKTILLQTGSRLDNPSELLLYMNEVLENQTAGNFVTAFYGIYDPDTRILRYANAGHNQPYIIRQDRVSQLQGGKNTAIAMFPNNMLARANKKFDNNEDLMERGTKLLLYTDGLVEARPMDSDIFFEHADMEEVFRDNLSKPCGLFLENLMKELVAFRESENFDDDICLICMDIV